MSLCRESCLSNTKQTATPTSTVSLHWLSWITQHNCHCVQKVVFTILNGPPLLMSMTKLAYLLDRWSQPGKVHSLCLFLLQWRSCRCPQDMALAPGCRWGSKTPEGTAQRTQSRQGRQWSRRWRWACLLVIPTCSSSQPSSYPTADQVCEGMKQTQCDHPKHSHHIYSIFKNGYLERLTHRSPKRL